MATNLEVVGSNPRLASFFYRVLILTKINSLAFDEKRREEEEESCRRGLPSREDVAMINTVGFIKVGTCENIL